MVKYFRQVIGDQNILNINCIWCLHWCVYKHCWKVLLYFIICQKIIVFKLQLHTDDSVKIIVNKKIRFNNAPTDQYDKDVGNKTSIRIVNSQVRSQARQKSGLVEIIFLYFDLTPFFGILKSVLNTLLPSFFGNFKSDLIIFVWYFDLFLFPGSLPTPQVVAKPQYKFIESPLYRWVKNHRKWKFAQN